MRAARGHGLPLDMDLGLAMGHGPVSHGRVRMLCVARGTDVKRWRVALADIAISQPISTEG